MQTHTSTEIAQAMVDRAFASVRRYPQPVELPATTCLVCDGTGDRGSHDAHLPKDLRLPCRRCHGAGTMREWCCFCRKPATTILFDDDGYRWEVCSDCSLSDEPADKAIAWGLRQGMAMVMEVAS